MKRFLLLPIFLNPLTETVQAVNWYGTPAGNYQASAEIFGMDGRLLWAREVAIRLQKEDVAGLPKVSVSGFNVEEREFSKK